MTARSHPRPLLFALILLVGFFGTACSSTDSASRPHRTTTRVLASSPASSATMTTGTPSTVAPKEVSDFPDGVYRTQLTVRDLQNRDIYDYSNAGLWTLIVNSGTYELDCRAISDPTLDCGNSHPYGTATVEFGYLRGEAPEVWFVHDMARLSKLNGCVPHSLASNGCGPEGGYHIDWKQLPDGIAFSNFIGLGDEAGFGPSNNWTAKPWTRIS